MYKLIAIDMDGTLLNDQHEVSNKVKDTLAKAKEAGIKIVLCSGRPITGMKDYINELGLNQVEDYAIAYNGAYTQNNHTNKVISSYLLEHTDLLKLYDLSLSLKTSLHFFDFDYVYTPNRDISEYTVRESFLSKLPLRYRPMEEVPKNLEIPKILYIDHPSNLSRITKELPKELFEEYNIVRNAAFFLAFVHPEASKGMALKNLAERLGIKREEILSIGDNENDLSMIQYAGCGVAMGNAIKKLKEAANFQTRSNNEHGVAYAIEEIVFNS